MSLHCKQILSIDEDKIRKLPSEISVESQLNHNYQNKKTNDIYAGLKADDDDELVLLNDLLDLSSSPQKSHSRSYSDDQSSNKDSIISSLSSHSLDNFSMSGSNRQQYLNDHTNNNNYIGVDIIDDDNLLNKASNIVMNKTQANQIYNELFLIHNIEANTFDNKYYKEQVKIKSTLPRNYNVFKEKTRLVQVINFHSGAIWTMKISPSGSYLGTAGQDTNIIIWCIGNNPLLHPSSTSSMDNLNDDGLDHNHINSRNIPKDFISSQPYRILQGHTGDVIDIAWSKSDFLLSASTDKTVCLWHVSRADCLQFFRHPDIVTAIEFHPAHDRYYISGCFDRKIRVWDIIPDGVVLEWTQTTDTITSLCFSPNGKTVLGGLINGKVFFYDLIDFDQLKYKTQMYCRNRGGKYSRGTKVTGLAFLPNPNKNMNQSTGNKELNNNELNNKDNEDDIDINNTIPSMLNKLLVSTNDSRIRLCRLDDYSLQCKYKGLHNKSMQIKASFSNDGKYVISGSETGEVLIWSTKYKKVNFLSYIRKMGNGSNRNDGYESFNRSSYPDCATTVAIFASSNSLFLHLKNNIHLLSSKLSTISSNDNLLQKNLNEEGLQNHINDSNDINNDITNVNETNYTNTESMLDHNSRIILTADYDGVIRVFFRLT